MAQEAALGGMAGSELRRFAAHSQAVREAEIEVGDTCIFPKQINRRSVPIKC